MSRLHGRRKQLSLHLMLIPAVVLVLVFNYVPMAGIVIAFQSFIPARGFVFSQRWIGLDNFKYIVSLPTTFNVLRNTILISTGKIVVNMIVPIVFALLLNEVRSRPLKRSVQTMIYFPYFLSWVVVSGIIIDTLSPSTGIVNKILGLVGIEPIFFLGDKTWFPITMIITDVWKNFGYGTIIYLASISTISPALYEVASIDGANRWQKMRHITLPGMTMIIVLLLVLNLGNVLNAGFEQVFNLLNAQVYDTGDIIDTMVYRLGLIDAQFGPATAVGLFKSIVSLLLISSSYYVAYRYFNYRVF